MKPTKIKRISVTYPEDIATKLAMDKILQNTHYGRRGMSQFIRERTKSGIEEIKANKKK